MGMQTIHHHFFSILVVLESCDTVSLSKYLPCLITFVESHGHDKPLMTYFRLRVLPGVMHAYVNESTEHCLFICFLTLHSCHSFNTLFFFSCVQNTPLPLSGHCKPASHADDSENNNGMRYCCVTNWTFSSSPEHRHRHTHTLIRKQVHDFN